MAYYINKLYICNFKPFVYENNPLKPYITIDFNDENKEIQSMILSGPNGYGKTSIFQAIYFVLSGIVNSGEYVDGRKKSDEHVVINDLSKPCFAAAEFKDERDECFTFVRYTEKGMPGTSKKTEKEAPDFQLYSMEGEFSFTDFMNGERQEKTRNDIDIYFNEKNIIDWLKRNYIQQEHDDDIVLKSDKERVNFLNKFIDMETDEYFGKIKEKKDLVKQDIGVLEEKIKELVQKTNVEIKEIQGKEPICPQVYPELKYIWDKERYKKAEPFQEYEEKANRVLKIVNNLALYKNKRIKELIESLDNRKSFYKYYILSLYEADNRKKYSVSFAKKQYLKKLLEEENIWTIDLNEEYLENDFCIQIRKIREKHQKYIESLDDRQYLYKQIELFRKNINDKEDAIGNIFDEHCPLCGSSFKGKNTSLGQAIRQANSIFAEAQKILDVTLEEQGKVWKDEKQKALEKITQWYDNESADESLCKDIQEIDRNLVAIDEFDKILEELNSLTDKKTLTIFTDKTKFRERYQEISEYQEALSEFGKVITLVRETSSIENFPEDEIDKLAYSENKKNIVSLIDDNGQKYSLMKKIKHLQWLKNEKDALEYSINNSSYEEKIKEIKCLYEREAKLDKILECQDNARKAYLNELLKYLEIPLYIYSGKLIQTHQSGLGIFCFTGKREDALTEFKMTTDKKNINKKLDVSNRFSTGQKNVINIALMLALKKIQTTNLNVLMIDDPCQSLDELNIASFVEIIKNEFTKTQIILSTHEDKIASYIKYKINKAGKGMIMFNVQDRLYNVQE